MTAVPLKVAFRDVRADALALSFDPQPGPALGVATVTAGCWQVQLRVLGASHQVLAAHEGLAVSETVACGVAGRVPLPPTASVSRGPVTQRFSSRVRRLNPAALEATARRLVTLLGPDPAAIVAVFPGSPAAVTAARVVAAGGGARWRTWHCYPETGELATTAGEVTGCPCHSR